MAVFLKGGGGRAIGPQRRSLWGLRLKIAHVLGFPTRIARSRSASKRRAEKGQGVLCRARV